jgi:hypothetical protein
MFLFGRYLHVPLLIFNFILIQREIPLGFIISGLVSLSKVFFIAVTSLILGHMLLSAVTGHLCYSNYTTIDMFPFLLKGRNGFLSLESFLISLSFPIPNQNTAIKFLFFSIITLFTFISPGML